jgi:hypothetical protein
MNQQCRVQNVTLPSLWSCSSETNLYLENQPLAGCGKLELQKCFKLLSSMLTAANLPFSVLSQSVTSFKQTSSTLSLRFPTCPLPHTRCPIASFSAPTLYSPDIPHPNTKFHFQFLCLSYFSKTSARVSKPREFTQDEDVSPTSNTQYGEWGCLCTYVVKQQMQTGKIWFNVQVSVTSATIIRVLYKNTSNIYTNHQIA